MKEKMSELINKYKKNSKLSIADKNAFESELAKELSQGVFSDEVETILFEGPIDSAMKVLAQFLSHSDRASSFQQAFFDGKRMRENKGGTAGMRLVVLCSYFIYENPSQNDIFEKMFLKMVHYAYKNGKNDKNKKVVDLIREYILPKFPCKEKVFDWTFISDENMWKKTRDLFVDVITKDQNKNFDAIQRVYYWLRSSEKEMGIYTEEYIREIVLKPTENVGENELKKSTSKESRIQELPSDSETSSGEPEKSKQIKKENESIRVIADNDNQLDALLKSMVAVLLDEAKQIDELRKEIEHTNRKIEELLVQANKHQIMERQQEETIRELVAEKKILQGENSSYAKRVSELEKIVEAMSIEIDNRKQFADTVARNREKQSEAYLNRLASKLRVDYQDYCDAKDLDMTVELGENMREQLGAVFAILEKNGISIS